MNIKKIFHGLDRLATSIPVSKVMKTNVKNIKATESVKVAVDLMAKHSYSGLIVLDSKDLPIGMVSGGDIIKKVFHKAKKPDSMKVRQIMNKGLRTIDPDLSIGKAAAMMKKEQISKLPVVKGNKIIGIVTKSDLLQKLNDIYYQNKGLKWYPVIILALMIIISVLLVALTSNYY